LSAAVARAGELVVEASRDDAFTAFYQATARDLWAYVAGSTGDPAVADDVTQEAYLRWLGAAVEFQSDEHRRRYLFRIASNLMQDRRRVAQRRPEAQLEPHHEPAAAATEGPDATALARHDVGRALARLKPRDRRVLWLAHVEEASHEEIAAMVGARASSVRVLLFRARRRLARALETER
jgi:RNA polymerase sigma-70 factor (ECF subfamily)